MNYKLIQIILWGLFLTAGGVSQESLFSDNFESGSPNSAWNTFWEGEDALQVISISAAPSALENGGDYVGFIQDADGSYTGAALAVAGDTALTNYSIEADVYCYVNTGSSTSRYTGIAFYANPGANLYYKLVADFDSNMGVGPRLRLYNNKMNADYTYTFDKKFYAADIPAGIPSSSGWHKLRVDVVTLDEAVQFTCYFDGEMVGNGPVQDTSAARGVSGKFGLFSFQMGNGVAGYFDNVSVSSIQSTSIDDDFYTGFSTTPTALLLFPNFPNPFNPQTLIRFQVNKPEHVTLSVYDLMGREVRVLLDGFMNPGEYSVIWDGAGNSGEKVSSGIYLYQLRSKDRTITGKMTFAQ